MDLLHVFLIFRTQLKIIKIQDLRCFMLLKLVRCIWTDFLWSKLAHCWLLLPLRIVLLLQAILIVVAAEPLLLRSKLMILLVEVIWI
jgi:hypothetical protein